MEIRPFEFDYKELIDLIDASWPREHNGYIDYTEPFLRHIIESPDTDNDLTLCIYKNNKLVSFLYSKKTNIYINGIKYKALLNSLASTRPDEMHWFPYIKLKDYCIKKAIKMGYQLNFGFAAMGIQNNNIEQLYAQKNKFYYVVANSFGALNAIPGDIIRNTFNRDNDIKICALNESLIENCLQLINQFILKKCTIYQEWKNNSFLYYFSKLNFSEGKVILKKNKIVGFVGYSKFIMKFKTVRRKICVIYHFFMDNLDDFEKETVLHLIANHIQKDGFDGISIPNTGYFSFDLLYKKIGLKRLPFQIYKTNLLMSMFTEKHYLKPKEKFYLEIL